MAKLLRGKDKGKTVKIHQWCNNWFSIEYENKAKIVSPIALEFTMQEICEIEKYKDKSGFLFEAFILKLKLNDLTKPATYVFKRKRS